MSAIWPRKLAASACATALAVVLLWPRPGGETGGGETKPDDLVGDTIEKYEDGSLQEQADEAADALGLTPAGDTCLMRHVNLARDVPRDFRRVFATVQLASGAQSAREALQNLKSQTPNPDPMVHWRLELETARLAMRAGDIQAARDSLRTLIHTQSVPATCQADTLFHLALLSQGPEAFDLLEQAAQLDPVALQVQEARLAHQLRSSATSAQACAQQVSAQIESIVYINSLVRSDRELFRLEALALSAPKGVMQDLMLGLLAEARSDPEAAKTAFARAQSHPRNPCAEQALYFASRRLAALEDPS